jgi:enamine deaminase RidA (YjgF/YER057c/UK114 family)
MTPENRLARQGLALPVAGNPAFDYEPFKTHGDVVYLAGQLAKEAGEVTRLGRVGAEIDEAEGVRQMRLCALHSLAWLKQAAGGELSNVRGILHLNAYIACTAEFDGISRLADAASRILIDALGPDGRHPRSVLGLMRLPRNAPVMIDLKAVCHTEI